MRKETSTNSINEALINEVCGTAHALSIIGGRWKPTILHILLHGKFRYSKLRAVIPGISERMLVLQLRELEAHGIVLRTVHPEVPPRVEYELTPHGLSMREMLQSISAWGQMHKNLSTPETADTRVDNSNGKAIFDCSENIIHP